MLEAYSVNVTVDSETAIPLNNVTVEKGCTAVLSAPATIQLNKRGVYMVACNSSSAAATTIQLYKDGLAQPQAQSTGDSCAFVTLVQVESDNKPCCCGSPTTLQLFNDGEAAATFTNVNVVITKVC